MTPLLAFLAGAAAASLALGAILWWFSRWVRRRLEEIENPLMGIPTAELARDAADIYRRNVGLAYDLARRRGWTDGPVGLSPGSVDVHRDGFVYHDEPLLRDPGTIDVEDLEGHVDEAVADFLRQADRPPMTPLDPPIPVDDHDPRIWAYARRREGPPHPIRFP